MMVKPVIQIAAIVLMCIRFAEPIELYSDKYDSIDFLTILNNDRLRNQYYRCFIGKSPCTTNPARFFKTIISEAYVTNCKRCTEKQKQLLDTTTEWYTTNAPVEWQHLVEKFIEREKQKNLQSNHR